MTKIKLADEYLHALSDAKAIITQGQEKFLKSTNRISMEIRLQLGKIIEENTIRYDWGKNILENFANDLLKIFPDTKGFFSKKSCLYAPILQ